jgi:hypothetical protein
VQPYVDRAIASGELLAGLTPNEAVEWITITLSTVGDLIEASGFDLDDPVEVGRFYAARVCYGLVRPQPD